MGRSLISGGSELKSTLIILLTICSCSKFSGPIAQTRAHQFAARARKTVWQTVVNALNKFADSKKKIIS